MTALLSLEVTFRFVFTQVQELFEKEYQLSFECELFPYRAMTLLGYGFPMLIDYFLGLCFFPTKTAYEKVARGNREVKPLLTVVDKQIHGHHTLSCRDAWKKGWIAFLEDPDTQSFARKPQFPRIGIHGTRVTSFDLERSINQDQGNDDGDESDGLLFDDVRIKLMLSYYNVISQCDFPFFCFQ